MLKGDQLGAVHQQTEGAVHGLRGGPVAEVAEDHRLRLLSGSRFAERSEVLAQGVADEQRDRLIATLMTVGDAIAAGVSTS